MTKKFDDLNDAFNVAGDIVSREVESIEEKVESIASVSNDLKKDYEYTRGNLYSIIEKGQEALNGILELAQESEMPRAYEVAGQLIKNVADATDKLIDLQKKLDAPTCAATRTPGVSKALQGYKVSDLSQTVAVILVDCVGVAPNLWSVDAPRVLPRATFNSNASSQI